MVDFELTPSNVQDSINAKPSQPEVVLQQDVTRTEITGQPDSTKQTTATNEIKHHSRPPVQAVFAPGHYVVAASFNSMEYARAFAKRLSDAGVSNPLIGYNSANKMQYVYVFSSYDIKECRKVRDQLRMKKVTKDVWILSIH